MSTITSANVKQYPILYKIAKNGKVLVWKITIVPKNANLIHIEIKHGYEDGKWIDEEPIEITEGKQKRSLIQQAELIANSRFNKQIKKNYRESLTKPQKRLFIKPYLLQNFRNHSHKIKYPAFIQPKFDGVRALLGIYKLGDSYKLRFSSRNSKFFPNQLQYIKKEVIKSGIIKKLGFFLDGEIYNHDLILGNITSIINAKTPSKDAPTLYYYVFDYIDLKNPNEGYSTRYKKLKELLSKHNLQYVRLVPQKIVKNKTEAEKIAEQYIKNGYEGAVIRNTDFTYRQTRIYDAQKIKKQTSDEFKIVGIKTGKGKFKNVPIFTLITIDGNEFRAVPVGSQEFRERLWRNRAQLIGKMATVVFQEFTKTKTKKGIKRVPRDPRLVAIRDYE